MAADDLLSGLRELPAARAALLAAGATTAAATVIAHRSRHVAPFAPELVHVDINCQFMSRGILPIRIAFVTDTHVGPAVRGDDVDRALRPLVAAAPDLLLLGGDYLCESPRYIPEVTSVLACYASLPRYGAFAVLGNHDHSNDAPRLQHAFERRGIRVLVNESVSLDAALAGPYVAGIDDAILGRPDLESAFSGVPANAPVIALWHEPDWAAQTAACGAALQLSGHSHGGQVCLPAIGPIAAPAGGRRFVSGIHPIGELQLYTSRGVGVYRPAVRFRCAPEVTLLTVR